MNHGAVPFKPLEGIRVLDLSRYLPGPYLTRILADLGADIIKVESEQGDPARYMPPQKGDFAAVFAAVNAGKRSIVIDLKKQEGIRVVEAFVAKCDIVVESFRPGVADRLGVGYEALRKINPAIIMCSISGYGQSGPLASVPGHDINYVARAGVLGLFGPADGLPAVPGVQMADIGGGSLTAATGVLAALLEREKTGVGRFLDISMTRSVLSLAATASATVGLGVDMPRGKGFLSGGIPCYRVYETQDGRFMALGALEPKFFGTFCNLIGAPQLTEQIYAMGEEGARAEAALEAIFKTKTQAQWVAALDGHDVCCEPVRTMEEALADPQLELSQTDVHGARAVLPHFGVPPSTDSLGDAPSLGAHGKELLEEFGIDSNLIAAAKAASAIIVKEP